MKILILGGSGFLGRHLVDAALVAGHQVTLLNRGKRSVDWTMGRKDGADFSAQLEHLLGDRDADMSALQGRQFDAVIDGCCYLPDQAMRTVASLGIAPSYFQLISTISVYREFAPRRRYDETASLLEGAHDYGSNKARCEEVYLQAWPGKVAIVRPGLIVGPHDMTERFTYWPRRVAQGGDMLAAGQPDSPLQWIDVRDLAQWCLRLAEQNTCGIFNACGPAQLSTFGEFLATCQTVTASSARLHWVSDEKLVAAGIAPWTEIPVWLPQDDAQWGGLMYADNRRALEAGLQLRPLAETVHDTLAWDNQHAVTVSAHERPAKHLTMEREAFLLAQCAGNCDV